MFDIEQIVKVQLETDRVERTFEKAYLISMYGTAQKSKSNYCKAQTQGFNTIAHVIQCDGCAKVFPGFKTLAGQ